MCVSVIKSADVDDLAQSCVFLYCHVGLQQSLRGIHSFVDEQKGVEYQFEAVKHFKHSLRSTVVHMHQLQQRATLHPYRALVAKLSVHMISDHMCPADLMRNARGYRLNLLMAGGLLGQ